MSKIKNIKDWDNFPNFKPEEFRSPGEKRHIGMDWRLMFILETVRHNFKKPIKITSGYRSKKYNDKLVKMGIAIPNSAHTRGEAVDFTIDGVCKTDSGRQKVANYLLTLPYVKYVYYNKNGSHPNMGTSIHINI